MFGLPPGPGNPGVVFGDQVRGVGFLHDGGVATIFQFLNAPRFTFGSDPNTNRRNVEQFILSLDTGLAPIVGQQVTVGTAPDAAVTDRLALLLARADAGECAVVVKGIDGGASRGALYAGGGMFLSDRASEPPVSLAAFIALAAVPGQEQTFTAVPPGDGARIAVDRDEDGVRDADERDAGASSTDASSTPGGPAFSLVQSTRLGLTDGSRRKLTFVSKSRHDAGANRIVPPTPGSPDDPSLHGATLIVYDAAGSGEAVAIPLAAAGWDLDGSADRPRWSYRGTTPADAISHVVVGADLLAVKGGGAGFAYTLDEPHQGRIAVRLVLGTATVLCAEAPARTSGTPPSPARYDRTGRFTGASRTPPPPACPGLPVAG